MTVKDKTKEVKNKTKTGSEEETELQKLNKALFL